MEIYLIIAICILFIWNFVLTAQIIHNAEVFKRDIENYPTSLHFIRNAINLLKENMNKIDAIVEDNGREIMNVHSAIRSTRSELKSVEGRIGNAKKENEKNKKKLNLIGELLSNHCHKYKFVDGVMEITEAVIITESSENDDKNEN